VSSPKPLFCSYIDIPVGGTYSTNGSSPTISSNPTMHRNTTHSKPKWRCIITTSTRPSGAPWATATSKPDSSSEALSNLMLRSSRTSSSSSSSACVYMVMLTIMLIYPPSHKGTTTPTHTTSGPTARCARSSSRMGICAQMHRWGETNWSSSTR
jgi:hypothetical protein